MPKSKMPSTLKRSPKKAQDTYEKTLEHAEKEYPGDEERSHRVAYASLKHSFEKVGDRWEPKKRKGPSDPEAAAKGDPKSHPRKKTFCGVDYYGHTKEELYERAKRLDIPGRSTMDKEELAAAIGRKQR
jgi:cation transport regulator ChaB